jgi:hypothetical protein
MCLLHCLGKTKEVNNKEQAQIKIQQKEERKEE